jgi:copper transport protein
VSGDRRRPRLPGTLTRRLRRLLVGAAVLVLLLLGTPRAGAHAYLESSNPADGSTLANAPRELALGFSEHVVIGATHVVVTDARGTQVLPTRLHLETADRGDTEEPAQVRATLPPLTRGTYRVSWETLSSDDLHRTAGFFVFGVRTSVATTPFQETPPVPGEAVATGALLIGFALALGGVLATWVARPLPGRSGARARSTLARVALVGAVLALAASLLQPLRLVLVAGFPLSQLVTGNYGVRWSVREMGLVLLVLTGVALTREAPWRRVRFALVSGALLTAVGTALLGHAAAGTHVHVDRVMVTAAHLVAALTWAGAVVCLAVVLGALRISGHLPVPQARLALRGFALPAAACVSVLSATGLYLSSGTVVSLDAMVATVYGRTLALKLLLAAAAGSLALVNHRRLRGPRDLTVPSRTLWAEGVLAIFLVAASGVLVSAQPATAPELVDEVAAAATAGPQTTRAADLQETFQVSPNRPGASVVTVTVHDTRRPSPGQVIAVTLQVRPGLVLPMTNDGDGRWSSPVAELAAGRSSYRLVVFRSGSHPVASRFSSTTESVRTGAPTVVSRAPLHALLQRLALLVSAGAALAWLVVALRLRARRRLAPEPEQTPLLDRAGSG